MARKCGYFLIWGSGVEVRVPWANRVARPQPSPLQPKFPPLPVAGPIIGMLLSRPPSGSCWM
jgi:hypothetical protein